MSASEIDLVHAMKGAVECGDVERVRELLDQGCSAEMDVNPGSYPFQLLTFAVRKMQLDVCKLLLERGADPKGWPQHNHIPLREAAGALGLYGFDQHTIGQRVALCRLLLDRGADPNDVGKGNCETALHLAMRCGSYGSKAIEVLRLLIQYGGDPSYAPPGASSSYRTPVQNAAYFGEMELLNFFFGECAQDPFQKSVAGRSLLQLCTKYNVDDCRELVRDAQKMWRSNQAQRAVKNAVDDVAGDAAAPSRRSSFSPI